MGVLPKKPLERVQFVEDRIAPWTTNATAIGTTTALVTALEAKAQAARTAYTAQQVALAAAKAATETWQQAVRQMSVAASAIIGQVHSAAKTSGPGVYPLAQIPAPALPSPVGAPGKPYEFAVELNDNGSLTLSWRCNNPPRCRGVLYQMWRKIDNGTLEYIGGSGEKRFVDATVPAGSSSIVYQMQAVRSTAIGPWASFIVGLGVGGGPTVAETKPEKLAA